MLNSCNESHLHLKFPQNIISERLRQQGEIHYQIKSIRSTYLLMSRSSTPICLPRKPNLLQNIPNIERSQRETENEAKKKKNKNFKFKDVFTEKKKSKSKGLLLPLHLVIDKNSSSECAAADLLHDLVMIHSRLHFSSSELQKQKKHEPERDLLMFCLQHFSALKREINRS